MKILKTITETARIVYKIYSFLIDNAFDFLFGIEKGDSLQSLYCSPDYTITSGGTIVSLRD